MFETEADTLFSNQLPYIAKIAVIIDFS